MRIFWRRNSTDIYECFRTGPEEIFKFIPEMSANGEFAIQAIQHFAYTTILRLLECISGS